MFGRIGGEGVDVAFAVAVAAVGAAGVVETDAFAAGHDGGAVAHVHRRVAVA